MSRSKLLTSSDMTGGSVSDAAIRAERARSSPCGRRAENVVVKPDHRRPSFPNPTVAEPHPGCAVQQKGLHRGSLCTLTRRSHPFEKPVHFFAPVGSQSRRIGAGRTIVFPEILAWRCECVGCTGGSSSDASSLPQRKPVALYSRLILPRLIVMRNKEAAGHRARILPAAMGSTASTRFGEESLADAI